MGSNRVRIRAPDSGFLSEMHEGFDMFKGLGTATRQWIESNIKSYPKTSFVVGTVAGFLIGAAIF